MFTSSNDILEKIDENDWVNTIVPESENEFDESGSGQLGQIPLFIENRPLTATGKFDPAELMDPRLKPLPSFEHD